MDKCIFCGSAKIEIIDIPARDIKKVKCPLCICYRISNTAIEDRIIDNVSGEERILFSAHLRKNAVIDKPLELLSSDIMKIPEIVAPYKKFTAIDKINMVILFLAKASHFLGEHLKIDLSNTFTEFFCRHVEELRRIIDHLEKLDYVDVTRSIGSSVYDVILTVSGWQAYEKLKEINIDSKKAFVAMSFDKSLDDVFYNAIQPACEECGFNAVRIDLIEHNEKICDRIIAEIKESRFVIADFTGQKHGVYFEAGFAYGLYLKVIWTCKKREEDKLHFDTRQYNHIIWEDIEDLRKQLVNRIKAIIK